MRTAEQIEREEAEARGEAQMDDEDKQPAATVVASEVATKEAMDELAMLTEKMTLEKKNRRRKKQEDADMDGDAGPGIAEKSKAIKKTTRREKNRFKKSKKQLLH